jgi:hypothetical protein
MGTVNGSAWIDYPRNREKNDTTLSFFATRQGLGTRSLKDSDIR